MKLSQLHIYGYGKWIDQSFNLSDGLHVFWGPNESGKSTLISFIHSILYGFPPRNSSRLRYEPYESSRYGGRIMFQHEDFGPGYIERVDGRKSSGELTLQLADQQLTSENLLKKLLYNMDMAMYQALYSFNLTDLEHIYSLTSEEVKEHFISASALGAKSYLTLADQFYDQARSLYKKQGRVPVINAYTSQMAEQAKQLQKAKEENVKYLTLLDQASDAVEALRQLEYKLQSLKSKVEDLTYMKQHWAEIEALSELNKTLATNEFRPVTEDDRIEFLQLNKRLEIIQEHIRTKHTELAQLKQAYNISTLYEHYLDHKSLYKLLKQQLPQLADLQQEKHVLEVKLDSLERELQQLISQEQLNFDQAQMIEPWSLEQQDQLIQWVEELREIQSVQETIERQQDKIAYHITHTQKKADQLEATWETGQSYLTGKNIVWAIVGLLSTIALFSNNIGRIFGIVGLVTSVVMLGIALGKKSSNQSKEQWRETLAELDELSSQYHQLAQQEQEVTSRSEIIQQYLIDFRTEQNIPETMAILDLPARKEQVDAIVAVQDHINQWAVAYEEIQQSLSEKTAPAQQLSAVLPNNHTPDLRLENLNYFFQKIEQEKQTMTEFDQQQNYLSEQLLEMAQEEEQLNKQKKQLFKQYQVASDEAFYDQQRQTEQYQHNKERAKHLSERFNDYLTQYPVNSLEELTQKIKAHQEEIKTLEDKKEADLETKFSAKYDLEQLEDGKQYSHLLQAFENKKSELQAYIDEWLIQRTAHKLLQQTIRFGVNDHLPYIIEQASAYFKRLTEGRYQAIRLDETTITVLTQDQRTYTISELSRGTAEPLYIALRFAFIQHQANLLQLPIIIDDGFVNLDANRRHIMYNIIEELAETHQVLLFTFDEELLERLPEEQLTRLQRSKTHE